MANVIFKFGNQAAYDALSSSGGYDVNSLYFIEDTARLYKGSVLISDATLFVDSVPEFETAISKKIYVVTSGGTVSIYVKGDSKMEQVGGGTVQPGAITNLNVFGPDLLVTSEELLEGVLPDEDTSIPTSKAVATAIANAVGKIDLTPYNAAYVNVEAKAAEGTSGTILTFTTKGGSTKDVTIADLFLTAASYDSETHILTLTVGEDQTVEVNLEELVPQAVNTSQVAMADEIIVNVAGQDGIGNFKNGSKVDPSEIADLQTFLVKLMSQDTNPQVTQPSASITLTGAGAKEVGTKYTPQYSANLNPGSYSDNKDGAQPTGVTATTWAVTDTNSGSADTQTGSFSEFTVEDSTNYKVNVTVSYGDGNIPTTYLGTPYPDGQIKAGSKTASSSAVTGFRNCWWGFKNSGNLIADPASITKDQIKALGNSNRNKPTSLTATNMQQMFFAIPEGQATSLSIVGTNSPLPQTVQGPVTVQVGGVDDYSPVNYSVFYVSNAAPASGSETYKLTWK